MSTQGRSQSECQLLVDGERHFLALYKENQTVSIELDNDLLVDVIRFLDIAPSEEEIAEVVETVEHLQPRTTFKDILAEVSSSHDRTYLILRWLKSKNRLDTVEIDGVRLWVTPGNSREGHSEN